MTHVLAFVAGAFVASAIWWIKVRGFPGVKSDLADASSEVKSAVDKVKQ